MLQHNHTLIVIAGPTASGKTDVAIKIACHFNTEIISADSRQFYKEIPIGTAAPDKTQLAQIKHHFVGHLPVTEPYNVSRFEHDVLELLNKQFKKQPVMVMAGGSGLYIDAVCKGIDDLPDPDLTLRENLNYKLDNEGIEALQQQLKVLDPVYYQQVDLQNPKRLLRALEVCIQTGKPYSELRKNNPAPRNFNIIKIGLNLPREELFDRINRRTDLMIEKGWIEEAANLLNLQHLNALNTVGYKELFKYLSGEWILSFAIEKIKTNTRRYAKRQLTWFKKDTDITWFLPGEHQKMMDFINGKLQSYQTAY